MPDNHSPIGGDDWLPAGGTTVTVSAVSLLRILERNQKLEEENKTLKLYYKDWLEQQAVVRKLRRTLQAFAAHATTMPVMSAIAHNSAVQLVFNDHVAAMDPLWFREAKNVLAETEPNPKKDQT